MSDGTLDAEIAHLHGMLPVLVVVLHICIGLKFGCLRPCPSKCSSFSQLARRSYCMGVKQDCAVLVKHLGLLSVFQMNSNCLRHICGISRSAHVPSVEILSQWQTFSVEFQLSVS